jgi:chemosensory pili system protein ChpA (sensor histidine kinase/response regulator)
MNSRQPLGTQGMNDDLSALAWVQEELRKSLDAAHKALRRYLKDAEGAAQSDVQDVEPAVLRTARQQIHQSVGALELIGLTEGAVLLRASEDALQRFIAKPRKLDVAAVETIERASFALLDYIGRRLAGKPISPVGLFPQLRGVLELAGAQRVHPADLWMHDWRWREIAAAVPAKAAKADADTLSTFETRLLSLMRKTNAPDADALRDAGAALAAASKTTQGATLWRLVAAFFEIWGHALVPADNFVKRMASRVLSQLRAQVKGDDDVSERLAQDLLFYCSRARAQTDGRSPWVAAVRVAYQLGDNVEADYNDARLGRFDPVWLAQARKRVSGAKDAWSAVAGGEVRRITSLHEPFSLVAESVRKLYPGGDRLADSLLHAAAQVTQTTAAPAAPLAMEVATSLLYVEASLEDGELDDPNEGERVQRLSERIERVQRGEPAQPLEPWMEDLYRRVSDRQTMGSVVQELRASLSEVERQMDQFFRNPKDRTVLVPVPAQLQSMRGVLSVLGMDQASQAVLHMRGDVDTLIATEVDPADAKNARTFERLAENLGALGFLIDMVSVQPHVAKSLFRFDASTGVLESVMGRQRPTPVVAPAVVPEGSAGVGAPEQELIDLAQHVADAAQSGSMPLGEVSHQLEELSRQPLVTDRPDLAASVSSAQAAIEQAEQAGAGPATEAIVREHVAQAMVDFMHTASDPVGLEPFASVPAALSPAGRVSRPAPLSSRPMPLQPAAAPMAAAVAPAEATGLEEDDEMRDIFLEEAREVVETATAALASLEDAPADVGQITVVRRSFHTLKGSSRMVGLKDFGDAAWSFEQLYNAWLAEQKSASPELQALTGDALRYMASWVDEIAAKRTGGHSSPVVVAAADALRLNGRLQRFSPGAQQRVAAPAPAAPVAARAPEKAPVQPVAAPVPPARPADTRPADGLRLDFSLDTPAKPAAAPAPASVDLDFHLDLGALEAPAGKPAQAQPSAAMPLHTLDLGEPLQVADALPEPEVGEVVEVGELVDLDLDLPLPDVAIEAAAVDELDGLLTLDSALDPDAAQAQAAPQADAFELTDLELPTAETVEPATAADANGSDQVKVIGPLRISIPLFNIYLAEADELSRRLSTELAEWAMELHRPVGEGAIALAHSLAGSSATVGFADLSQLARLLERTLLQSNLLGAGRSTDASLFIAVAEEIRRLLHQFAAGFLSAPPAELLERLREFDLSAAGRAERVGGPESARDLESRTWAQEAAGRHTAPAPLHTLQPPAAHPRTRSTDFAGLDADAASPGGTPSGLQDLGQPELRPLEPLAPQLVVPHMRIAAPDEDEDDPIDAVDAVDADLFPIFEEEAQELLPQLSAQMRDWVKHPGVAATASACMRTLHTFKGGARLAGAMRLGEMAHRLESAIEQLLARDQVDAAHVEPLENRVDAITQAFEALRSRDEQAYVQAQEAVISRPAPLPVMTPVPAPAALAPVVPVVPVVPPMLQAQPVPQQLLQLQPQPALRPVDAQPLPVVQPVQPRIEPAVAKAAPAPVAMRPAEPPAAALPAAAVPAAAVPAAGSGAAIDWSQFRAVADTVPLPSGERLSSSTHAVRVRAQLLDRLVNQAGEVSITRARLESEVGLIKGSIGDLTDNLDRLRQQLRDIELQAETQMSSRMEAAKHASAEFDPLEFDRFTRFQELTRMMAESVNDVATVQRSLQRTIETTEDELASQARLTRDLQSDLLRTRMVEFDGLSERLYRVVRQAAKESGKQVRLDIVGGSIEVDRGVLERMTGAFEHLLRNCVVHGIESPEVRRSIGKDAAGNIVVALEHAGNEVSLEFRDDGGGLNLPRIQARAIDMGLIAQDASPSEAELANLIFTSGFSTADKVSELAGRGVGMDVVRAEVNAMGGRVETATAKGQGTSFKLRLPLTTAVTQVVMLRCGTATIAVPSNLVEIVRRAKPDEVAAAYDRGTYVFGEQDLPFFWLGSLLQLSGRGTETGRTLPVVVIRSAQQRIVLHVDEVLGNQEVVVKNLGPQLSRVPGLAGMTLLASGAVALIYNPVALATVYGESARAQMAAAAVVEQSAAAAPVRPQEVVAPAVSAQPLVLVVDDSLTVRRVTQRLLAREGYRVALAKDGLDALEVLTGERPSVVLSDIEMPRMDGFDLLRNIRGDKNLHELPVIMITSRIAQKHRDFASELGANHYLGKPYSEEELLALVRRYTAEAVVATS